MPPAYLTQVAPTQEVKLPIKNDNKRRSHLKLIRKGDNIEDVDSKREIKSMKAASLRERFSWRGIEAKSFMLGLASLSVLAAVIVLFGLSAYLSMVN